MITLICGLPRAGKTTYSNRFDDVIHLDNSGGYGGVNRRLQHKEGDIVVEGVYNTKSQRESLLRAYKGKGTRCIYLDTPQEVRKTRQGWDKFCDYPFEEPSLDEGWDEILVLREDNNAER